LEFELRDKIDDQYKVIEKHRGGMSVVYIVLDEFSQRHFAVKTLKEELLSDRAAVNRFSREAKTWLNLGRHPNIVEAIIYREIEEQPFLFLEYVEGTDLQKLFDAESRLFPPQLLSFAFQVCAGMEYVHNLPIGPEGRGVVHRDLKPSNLMLTRQADVKVSDFGLAKVHGGGTRITDAGLGLGTYLYMPPEQFMDAASADRSSDIYSMGVVLYVATTGQMPVQGENVGAVIRNILNREPVRPSQLVKNVPEALEEVIMRCLAKERVDRYQSFSELARALGDVESSILEAVAGEETWECQGCGYLTQHSYRACPVCVGTMHRITYRPDGEAESEAAAPQTEPPQAPAEVSEAPATDETTAAAADGLYERARKWQAEGDLRRAIALLRQVLTINPDHNEARQSLDEAALALVKQGSEKVTRAYNWPMFRGNITRTGYTPEVVLPPLQRRWQTTVGEWIIASPVVSNGIVFIGGGAGEGRQSGRIMAIAGQSGETMWEEDLAHEVVLSACVLDGKTVLFGVHNRLIALDVRTGHLLWQVVVVAQVSASPVAWENTVYFGTDDGRLLAVSSQSGQQIWEFQAEMGIYSSPLVWQGRVYVGSLDHHLYALDSTSGRVAWQFMAGGELYATPAFHQGRIYVSSADHRLYCVDAATGRRVWDFQTDGPIESSPAAWQSFIYVGSRDRRLYAVDAATGTHLWHFEAGDWVNSSPAISGRTVYCGSHDKNIYALETHTGVCLWQYETGGEIQSSPAISDRSVYVASNDGNLYCFRPRL